MIHWAFLIPVFIAAFILGFWQGIMWTIRALSKEENSDEEPEKEKFTIEIGVMKWRKKHRKQYLKAN